MTISSTQKAQNTMTPELLWSLHRVDALGMSRIKSFSFINLASQISERISQKVSTIK